MEKKKINPLGWSPLGWSPPALLVVFCMVISCTGHQEENEKIISANQFLVGTWKGEGKFLNVNLSSNTGPILFEININSDYTITGKVGDASLTETCIVKSSYGFEIKGKLDSNIKKDHELNRKHLIILLVMPEENLEDVRYSDANFHLKNNFIFDFAMQVGGVGLTKE